MKLLALLNRVRCEPLEHLPQGDAFLRVAGAGAGGVRADDVDLLGG